MADARALLKAKRQEARITHHYASYSASGQLRCIVCGTSVKQASMWEGHIGSKAHRTAVMKLKAREEAEAMKAKRKQSEEMDEDDAEEEERSTKRAKVDGRDEETSAGKAQKGFPAGFFSDPSKAPAIEDDNGEEADEVVTSHSSIPQPTQGRSQLDLEWELFQAAVVNAPAVDDEKEEDRQASFARATVFAEPELATSGRQGLPAGVFDEAGEGTVVEVPAKEETEEERRKRLEQNDRELIMDRLIEEERAQEEADSRVGLLKAKVEALKKARELKRNKMKKSTS